MNNHYEFPSTNNNKRKFDDLYLSNNHNDYGAYGAETYPTKRQATDSNNVMNNNNKQSDYYTNYNTNNMYDDDIDTIKKRNTYEQIPVQQHLEYIKPQQQQQQAKYVPPSTTTSPPQQTTVTNTAPRREISLNYINEIANFAADDVKLAMSSRIDDETGEIYGPYRDYACGASFQTFSSLVASGVHKSNANSPLISYFEEEVLTDNQKGFNIKPASSVLIYDTDDHEDRGNVILFSSPYKVQILNASPNSVPIADRGNKALVKNMQGKIPVRVIRGKDNLSTAASTNQWTPQSGYRYDGLYFVCDFSHEKYSSNETSTTWSFVFKLVRIYGQPQLQAYTSLVMNQKHVVHQPRVTPPGPNKPDRLPYNLGLVDTSPSNESHYITANYATSQHKSQPTTLPGLPTSVYNYGQTPPPQQTQQRQPQQAPPPQPQQASSGSSNNTLNHDRIKQMLDELRNKNNTFNSRMSQYNKDMESLSFKTNFSVDGGASSQDEASKIVTSRNKDFFWKLNEGEDKPKKSKKANKINKKRKASTSRGSSSSEIPHADDNTNGSTE